MRRYIAERDLETNGIVTLSIFTCSSPTDLDGDCHNLLKIQEGYDYGYGHSKLAMERLAIRILEDYFLVQKVPFPFNGTRARLYAWRFIARFLANADAKAMLVVNENEITKWLKQIQSAR